MRKNPELGGRQGRQLSEWDILSGGAYDTPERRRATSNEFRRYAEHDEPSRTHHCTARKQLSPNVSGGLAAIGFVAITLADIYNNGPSSFVVNNPEAATLGVAAGAAFFGGVTSSLVYSGNASEISNKQREKRLKWQAEFERQAGGRGTPEEMKQWQSRGGKAMAGRNNNERRSR